MDEIRANRCNLNIARYVDVTEEEVTIDVQKVLDDLRILQKERSALGEKDEKGHYKTIWSETDPSFFEHIQSDLF